MEDLKDVCGRYEIDEWDICNWFMDYRSKTCKNNCYLQCDKVLY